MIWEGCLEEEWSLADVAKKCACWNKWIWRLRAGLLTYDLERAEIRRWSRSTLARARTSPIITGAKCHEVHGYCFRSKASVLTDRDTTRISPLHRVWLSSNQLVSHEMYVTWLPSGIIPLTVWSLRSITGRGEWKSFLLQSFLALKHKLRKEEMETTFSETFFLF